MKNDIKKISKLKIKALELKNNYQIPKYLYLLIVHLDINSDKEYLSKLMVLSEHYMRVKGYYKKYSQVEKEAEDTIREILKK